MSSGQHGYQARGQIMKKTKHDLFEELTGKQPADKESVETFICKVIPYFETLNPKAAKIISKRYGLNGKSHTFVQIGIDHELSSDRVRQIMRKTFLHFKYDKYRTF